MLRDFFIPAAVDEPPTLWQQHASYGQSGLIYEAAQPTSAWLATTLEKLRQPAYGFTAGSKAWQARAITAWCKVAEEWKALRFPGAKKFLGYLVATTGLSEKMLKEALHNHFGVFDAEILTKWLNRTKRRRDQCAAEKVNYPELVFLIAAGNIPGVAIHPLIHLSLLGIPTLVKNASTEPLLLPAILETLARHDAEVAARLLALTWPRTQAGLTEAAMACHPALVAFGDEETIATFTQQRKRFVDFGDRFTLTLAHPAGAQAHVRKIAYDFCMFEQMGCLSPQAIFLFTEDWRKVDVFCRQLAQAMERMNVTLPILKRSPVQQAMVQQWRGALVARGAAGEKMILLTGKGTDWTVAAATHFDLDERVACRFIRVWPVAAITAFDEVFQRYQNRAHILIWGNSVNELQRFWNAPELDQKFDRVPFTLAGQAQMPNCGWLEDVNPAWQRLMYGLRLQKSG